MFGEFPTIRSSLAGVGLISGNSNFFGVLLVGIFAGAFSYEFIVRGVAESGTISATGESESKFVLELLEGILKLSSF